MPRIEPVPPEQMTEEQRRLAEEVMAWRGAKQVRGPFAVLLHAPEIGDRVADFVKYFRSDTRVPHNLKELAILCMARRYTAQYEWFVHVGPARDSGVDDAVIEALRHGRRPQFADPDEALVHDMVEEIVESRRLGDDNYARAVAALGAAAVVELIALIGFYHAISVLLVSYQIEIPGGDPDPLPAIP